MGHEPEMEVRRTQQWDQGQQRSTAPGVLAAWSASPHAMKEVLAIIRPERWTATKARMQRLRIPAFTQHRVLGRGSEGGLHRDGALNALSVRHLPKRLVSWVVEASQVEALVQAIIEENRTGQPGDGKIFVLPVDGVLRVRTGDRDAEALKAEFQHETIEGTTTGGTP